ncbi:MAG: CopG family transcriptional regulator [Acidobacteria bacterium RIFCSPLOWO2_12_FULL_66_21]|nr:MAG: CopG family transcriptional regulator [Acidobacteria bacterium RIFCSPLOWO2_12_FULL_66_21]
MKKEYDFSKAKRGAVVPQVGKTRITIYLDDDVLDAFRDRADAAGRGYQTMINEALREHLGRSKQPLDADTIRRIVREEVRKTG